MRKLTLPNILTLSRILFVPVFASLFLHEHYRAALIVFVFTGLTDFIDGTLARMLGQKSVLGAVLDPTADKLLMLVTFLILAYQGIVPWWLTLLVIGRDLLIVFGVIILKWLKKKLYFKATILSKINTFCQLFTIFLAFSLTLLRAEQPDWSANLRQLLPNALRIWSMITAGMTILSGIQYTRIGVMILRGRRDYANLPIEKNKNSGQ